MASLIVLLSSYKQVVVRAILAYYSKCNCVLTGVQITTDVPVLQEDENPRIGIHVFFRTPFRAYVLQVSEVTLSMLVCTSCEESVCVVCVFPRLSQKQNIEAAKRRVRSTPSSLVRSFVSLSFSSSMCLSLSTTRNSCRILKVSSPPYILVYS